LVSFSESAVGPANVSLHGYKFKNVYKYNFILLVLFIIFLALLDEPPVFKERID
jgi:hypothetical protein